MPKERGLYWKPKMPEEISPEMFKPTSKGGDGDEV